MRLTRMVEMEPTAAKVVTVGRVQTKMEDGTSRDDERWKAVLEHSIKVRLVSSFYLIFPWFLIWFLTLLRLFLLARLARLTVNRLHLLPLPPHL